MVYCAVFGCYNDSKKRQVYVMVEPPFSLIAVQPYRPYCINASNFSILLPSFKLAFLTSFEVTYFFDLLTQEQG